MKTLLPYCAVLVLLVLPFSAKGVVLNNQAAAWSGRTALIPAAPQAVQPAGIKLTVPPPEETKISPATRWALILTIVSIPVVFLSPLLGLCALGLGIGLSISVLVSKKSQRRSRRLAALALGIGLAFVAVLAGAVIKDWGFE